MNESVAIRQRPLMLCKSCGHPSGPGRVCKVCGSPLDLRLHRAQAFSEDLFSHQRLLRPVRTEAPEGEGVEGPLASPPVEPDQPSRDASALREIVAPAAMEVASDDRSGAADPGQLIVLDPGSWWAASPTPAVRAALRREIGRTWVTWVGGFVGSVWVLDFLVRHV